MASMDTLRDLFIAQLRDTLSAEHQLVKALPKMAEKCNAPALTSALQSHWEETRGHVTRLEEVFGMIGETAKDKKCKGMEGLIKEGDEAAGHDGSPAVVDAGIIAAAQRVEHYEMAAYGCLVHYAELMGLNEVATILRNTLEEEKRADQKLTDVSDAEVMSPALSAGTAGVR
ncbi:MAG TPA: ferritin-like domain-containing protein [Gemmatimonadaceae bacterium]|nr:ferritin-like domain-containing protein [Gemmatimonadaceae bacterium]